MAYRSNLYRERARGRAQWGLILDMSEKMWPNWALKDGQDEDKWDDWVQSGFGGGCRVQFRSRSFPQGNRVEVTEVETLHIRLNVLNFTS